MNLNAVFSNLRNKGLRETWAIHKRRKNGCNNKAPDSLAELEKRFERIKNENNRLSCDLRNSRDRVLFLEQIVSSLCVDKSVTTEKARMLVEGMAKELESTSLDLIKRLDEGAGVFYGLQASLGKYYTLIDLGLLCPNADPHVRDFLEKMAELEPKSYVARLRKEYVWFHIPEAYSDACKAPVDEKKAVFLQPRRKMNQAFSYIYNYLPQRGYSVRLFELGLDSVPKSLYYWNAVNFARQAASAKVIFFHESNELLGHTQIRPETKVVQLWHGCGVFKKIGLDTAGLPGLKSRKGYKDYPEYNYYSCVTIASPDQSWVFERFMGIDKDSGIIKPLGVSRTDCFFNPDYVNQCYEKLYDRIPEAKTKKVILYAPTYRGVGKNRFAPDVLNIEEMAKRLSEDYILIIKHHQTIKDLPPIPDSVNRSFAFDMTRGSGMDISELMTVSDICVSDYSSLVCEFSLFERPIAFFVYDLDEYDQNRGLYYDFDEITPGPLCRTTDDLVTFIDNIDELFDKQKVIDFKNRFMSSCDGHATERIVDYIEDKLG